MRQDNRMTGANSSCLFAVVHGIISSTNKNFMNKIRMDLELLEQFLFHCGNDIMSLLEKENSVRFI